MYDVLCHYGGMRQGRVHNGRREGETDRPVACATTPGIEGARGRVSCFANQAVVDLGREAGRSYSEETDTEKFDRMMRETGLRADTGWMVELIQELTGGKPLPTLEEVREWLRGVPLSEWIIEDRGPR